MYLNLAREHHEQDAGPRFPLAAEKSDLCYLSRVLRLNNLAPDIIEAIIEGWPPFNNFWLYVVISKTISNAQEGRCFA